MYLFRNSNLLGVAETPRRFTLHPGRLHGGLLNWAAGRSQDRVHGDLDISSVRCSNRGSRRRFGRVSDHPQPLLLLLLLQLWLLVERLVPAAAPDALPRRWRRRTTRRRRSATSRRRRTRL